MNESFHVKHKKFTWHSRNLSAGSCGLWKAATARIRCAICAHHRLLVPEPNQPCPAQPDRVVTSQPTYTLQCPASKSKPTSVCRRPRPPAVLMARRYAHEPQAVSVPAYGKWITACYWETRLDG